MGTGKRPDIASEKNKHNIPGPGNYQAVDDSPLKKAAPKYGFGTSKREDSPGPKGVNVGPGAYELKPMIGKEGTQISISPKLNSTLMDKDSRNKPGPGTYEFTTTTLKNMPQYKIGTSKRSGSIPKDRLLSPDPGVYEPRVEFTRTAAASFGFGTSKRKSLGANQEIKVPGPGEYSLPSKAFDKPKFHMGIKYNDLSKQYTPGPGDYE